MVKRLIFKNVFRSSHSAGSDYDERGWVGAFARYIAVLTIGVMAAGVGAATVWDAVVIGAGDSAAGAPTKLETRVAVLEADEWAQSLRSEKFWSTRKGDGGEPVRVKLQPGPDAPPKADPALKVEQRVAQAKTDRTDAGEWYNGDGDTHRTVCVRLCDGYFWPISFSTTSDNFDRDKRTCEKSCGGTPTRLYVHENPGQDVTQMEDLKGKPYAKLPTAYLFRTEYNQSCKCNAHPWEQEAHDRHRIYALEADKRKGSKLAALELEQMKQQLKQGLAASRKALVVVAAEASPKLPQTIGLAVAAPAVPEIKTEAGPGKRELSFAVAALAPAASPFPYGSPITTGSIGSVAAPAAPSVSERRKPKPAAAEESKPRPRPEPRAEARPVVRKPEPPAERQTVTRTQPERTERKQQVTAPAPAPRPVARPAPRPYTIARGEDDWKARAFNSGR
jgi:hypothetical protein